MRRILRYYAVDTLSLYLVSRVATGMIFEKGLETLLLAGAGLAVASLLIKPIVNILLLPINLITFGLFRWVASFVALYIIISFIPGFKIIGFNFPGFVSHWFSLPPIILGGFLAIIIFSFLISFITSVIHWLLG